ncbi:sensor histidine kinase [Streptomyces jumonjinensis]|uniref:sensor histidine kinase n=1 Tax=Streptomyces jumonjinensis TaxID=1945 RepID=UPI002B215668|nr:HAMP domain-containing sensor histidine kinase [Streptomyces jumonjinensis]
MTYRASRRRVPSRFPHRGARSLRAKLTLINVALLMCAIVVACTVSLMGMRHFFLDTIDKQLTSTRDSIAESNLTLQQIEALSTLGIALDELSPGSGERGLLPHSDFQFVAVDASGTAIRVAGLEPTGRQRDLAAAVDDAGRLARSDRPVDVTLDDEPFRATAATLDDGTTVVLAGSTEFVHTNIRKAVKFDFGLSTVLLGLLAVLTMIGAHHRLRPLEDMVETASAIADGDLTRRVPSSRHPATEVEQLRIALNSMLQQVETAYSTRERSAEQLRQFVADASHELRTPLSAIRGYLQLFDRGMLNAPEDRDRAWSRINSEVDRMHRLVDELLMLARLDQRAELRLRNTDVCALVRDAAADLRAQQPERPVTVRADGVLLVHADECGLRQVLGNLVGNVRVHTPRDAPVELSVRRTDETVTVVVADRGPGLAEEDAVRVFDRFFRAGGGAGSGLGLAIVRGVVDAHGGRVTVRRRSGGGLAVVVALPAGPGGRGYPGETPGGSSVGGSAPVPDAGPGPGPSPASPPSSPSSPSSSSASGAAGKGS